MTTFYNSRLISGKSRHCFLVVAIPTYNKPLQLERAIASVIQQDRFNECQLLVVDNDSRKGETPTTQLMRKYESNSDILYYRNDINLGMYGNWNRCFELSDCKYLLLLHTDDFLLPGCLHYCLQTLCKKNYLAMYLSRGNVITLPTHPASTYWNKKRKLLNALFRKRNIEHKAKLKDTLFGFCLTAPTGYVMDKELFMQGYIFRLTSPEWPSDAELQLKLIGNGYVYMSEEKYVIKDEDGSNAGSNKKITVPLILTHKQLYFEVYKNEEFLFKKLLIYVRLRLIATWFRVQNEPEVRVVIPQFYYSKMSSLIYGVIKRLWRINYILR